jgi:hypothetical protein
VNLSPDDRRKLVAVLNLLSSDVLGERATAAATATRFIKARGLGWDEIVVLPRLAPPPDTSGGWREELRVCEQNLDLVRPKERAFLASIARHRVLRG